MASSILGCSEGDLLCPRFAFASPLISVFNTLGAVRQPANLPIVSLAPSNCLSEIAKTQRAEAHFKIHM